MAGLLDLTAAFDTVDHATSATTCSTISDHGCCSRSSSSNDSQPSRLLQQSACWPTILSTVSFTCGCSTCARPAWSCSSVSSHAWHAPLVEFPSAFHVQVMSADIQMSPWSDTWLIVSLLHVLHVSGRPLLRSADANKLLIPRSFRSSGPNAWNGMLAHLRNSDLTLSDFRQLLLKLALFRTVSVQLPSVPLWQSCAFRNMKLTDNETHRRKYTQDKHNKTLEKEEKESTINTSILK